MDNELEMLNPQIVEVSIGTRKIRKIKLYPLALGDQLKMTHLILKAIQEVQTKSAEDNFKFAEAVQAMLSENLGKILGFVADEGEILLSEVTNAQAVEITEQIYLMNYEVLEKKVKSLMERMGKAFQFPNSRQRSSEDILNTDLNISTEEVSETEE